MLDIQPIGNNQMCAAMSRLLRQQEDGIYFLCLVLMQKDRIEDSLHACSVAECSHGLRPSPHLLESCFNGVCCPHALFGIQGL